MRPDPTLAELTEILGGMCGGAVQAYHFATDHQSRTIALEEILEYAYVSLVENRHLNKDDGEDSLSIDIIAQLKMVSIDATHDTQIGGHCDILVRSNDHYLWIGEAKIHGGYDWLVKGFKQLSTRYATGCYGQNVGEIIIYCRNQDAASVLQNWKEKVVVEFTDTSITEDKINERLWFRTKHKCINSGIDFYTRHRILPLYWSPEP